MTQREDIATKYGAVNNADHRARHSEIRRAAQSIIDHSNAMAPDAGPDKPAPMSTIEATAGTIPTQGFETGLRSVENIYFGDQVKVLENGQVGGYLVRFSPADQPDLTGDYFDKSTELNTQDTLPILYQHGQDVKMGRRIIGKGKTGIDDIGLWIEAQLDLRDEYEKAVYQMAQDGKLGWSSGALGHLVEREPMGKSYHIKSWWIGEASLTPTPAEFRNQVIPLKSLGDNATITAGRESEADAPATDASAQSSSEAAKTIPMETVKMEMTPEQLQQIADNAAERAVKSYAAAQPAPDNAGRLSVTQDEADRPFKSLAELAGAVKNAALSNYRQVDVRLTNPSIKAAQGANESVPADSGYLIEPTIATELLTPLHDVGPFSSRVRRLPVSANSNFGYINGIDETSRVTGSRWGGVQGYRLAEATSITSSRPKFRRINWELKKFAVLMYATDELILDASQFNEVARTSAGEELSFMVNSDIVNGSGLAGPQGVLNSGALIKAARTDGSKIQHADILGMWQRMLPRYRAGAEWFINSEAEPQLAQLYFSGTTSVLSPYVSYGPDGVMRMFGKPVTVTEYNPGLNTAGDILLANMSDYLFWEKGEVQEATSIHIAFLTDEMAFRFIYRCDGQTSNYSAITPYQGSNTQSAFVSLTSAT